jgi:hypothetical protein
VISWPPDPNEFYLTPDAQRPVFQGDVFADVPFVKTKLQNTPEQDPAFAVERRLVTVLGYPCDLYQNGKLVTVQPVALVRPAAGMGIPPDWAGAFTTCPFPGLFDDEDHAATLQATCNVDARFLRREHRVASLSEIGWAVFRQRLALCSTRMTIHLDDLVDTGRVLWQELELWTMWNRAGRDEREFDRWLGETDAAAGGFSRRAILERGSYSTVLRLLQDELAAWTRARPGR